MNTQLTHAGSQTSNFEGRLCCSSMSKVSGTNIHAGVSQHALDESTQYATKELARKRTAGGKDDGVPAFLAGSHISAAFQVHSCLHTNNKPRVTVIVKGHLAALFVKVKRKCFSLILR